MLLGCKWQNPVNFSLTGKNKITWVLEVKRLVGGLLCGLVVAGGFGHEEKAWEMFCVRADEKSL